MITDGVIQMLAISLDPLSVSANILGLASSAWGGLGSVAFVLVVGYISFMCSVFLKRVNLLLLPSSAVNQFS